MRVVSSLLSGRQVLRGRAQRFKEKVKGCFSSTKFKLLIRNKAKEEELLFTVVCTLLHSYDPKSSLTVSVTSPASFQQQKCPRTREHKRIVALCMDAHARAHTQYQYMHFTATTEEVFFRVPNTTAFGHRRRVDIPGRSRDEIAQICVNYQHNLVIWEITSTKRL